MALHSLNEIFEGRLLRIPDYQRGYAWQKEQIEDFWQDIIQLDEDKIHYTGVITLEPVSNEIWGKWEEDKWIIEGLGYSPFYIVDGQQRLTTAMILIQAIIEKVEQGKEVLLNYQSIKQIENRYILHKAEDGLNRSFLFGYEKDNPSDEFLKTKIFAVHSHGNQDIETLYTRNLRNAKETFLKKLQGMNIKDIESLFKKLTQRLKFNLYEIEKEIDVFVTFETMNNRGKPLSSLELLKNRLIYLSTLFKEHKGKELLRTKINDAWKTIYEYLGKNPSQPLSDNDFLRNHWIMYFKYTRGKGDDYINFLLGEKFTAQNVTHPQSEGERLTVKEVDEYVINLQQSVRHWFYIHDSRTAGVNDENKMLIGRLQRFNFGAFRPLLLAAYVSNQKTEKINQLLIVAERYNFTLFTLSQRRANTGDSKLFGYARDLLEKSLTIPSIIGETNKRIEKYYDPEAFLNHISEKYKIDRDGFYNWNGLRYFLYEYEQRLRERGKSSVEKLSWDALTQPKKDYITVEHIFPQTASDPYWVKQFKQYSKSKKKYLTHSLGNLLPLSRARNSSLQNHNFNLKKNNGEGVGYYNGSASENEVATKADWNADTILERGLELLKFMEERWDISLGDEDFKVKLLHLDFVQTEAND